MMSGMSSADLPRFRPLPFLSNPHVQTVVGHFAGWVPNKLAAQSMMVRLTDGDAVAIHENTSAEWEPGGDCVLLVHGLGGSHRSKYLVRVARRLLAQGFRVYRMDLRGTGATLPHCRRLYNAACSGDVRAAFESVRERNPASRIFVVGFSLGGNIALKLAGEAADDPLPGLAGIAAVAAPIDLIRCSELILRYPFYDRFYVRNLVRQVDAHARVHPHIPAPLWPKPMTLRLFDELYTAPRGGFPSALEYYRAASSFPLVPRIAVPAFLLTARDDPFVAWQPYDELPSQPHLRVHIASGGGHLGFLGPDGRGGFRWAETQIVHWLRQQLIR
jgi:predicted alpha/beta-fold hydrolase